MVPKKEAMNILTECRKMLVNHLVAGMNRGSANTWVSAWLIDQGNILSPYAKECVEAISISESEISLRKQYGSELYDLVGKCFSK